jgi:hypothetical protein
MRVPQNDAAISTNEVLDYVKIIEGIAKVKAPIGSRFVGHKQKQTLFALACNAVKSRRGMSQRDAQGQPIHLPEEEAAKIKQAVHDFWLGQARKLVEFGEIVSTVWNAPKARAIETTVEGGGVRKDVALDWTATMKARRDSKDAAEFRLGLSFEVGKATKRLDYMKEHPEKGYSAEDVRAQHDFLTLLEGKLADMNAEKARLEALAGQPSGLTPEQERNAALAAPQEPAQS